MDEEQSAIGGGQLGLVVLATLAEAAFSRLFIGRYSWLATLGCLLDWSLLGLLASLFAWRRRSGAGGEFVRRHYGAVLYLVVALIGLSLMALLAFAPLLLPVRALFVLGGAIYLVRGRRQMGWAILGLSLTTCAYPLVWARGQQQFDINGTTWVVFILLFALYAYSYLRITDSWRTPQRRWPDARLLFGLCLGGPLFLLAGYSLRAIPERFLLLGALPLLQLIAYAALSRRRQSDGRLLTWVGVALLLGLHGCLWWGGLAT